MELNWSTFILEIINFGVLLWLLQHFLYRPVLGIIERRRQKINAVVEEAKQDRSKAEALRDEYNNRLEDWQKEREQALEKLQTEINTLRTKQTRQLQVELDEQREKARVAAGHEQQAINRALEMSALRQGSEFAGKLLTPLADSALEAGLVKLFIAELEALPDAVCTQMREGWSTEDTVEVTSVWPLEEGVKHDLQKALSRVLQATPAFTYKQDPALLAGLLIVAGSKVLGANLRDELHAFAEFHSKDGILER